jgi:transposase
MTNRRKYSQEFKLDAINLVIEQGYSRAEAARSLSINAAMLSRWLNEYQSEQCQSFRGNGKLSPDQLELRQLREENKRLKMEKEILKKAAAFFAQETK